MDDKNSAIFEHPDLVVERGQYKHVMALSLNSKSNYQQGLIRCIESRAGEVDKYGYVDKSVLRYVSADSSGKFVIGEKLKLLGEDDFLKKINSEEWECLGFEDPDIINEAGDGQTHIYFSVPVLNKKNKFKMRVHLGHAEGEDLQNLKITRPVLFINNETGRAKEVSIAPPNSQGVRLNLFESAEMINGVDYSIIRVAISRQAGPDWEFGETVFHPAKQQRAWCAEHASPGPLFPRSFIDVGDNRLLGLMNGREASARIGNQIKYGTFSPGLFIYNYEEGKIEWVADQSLFKDSAAKTITFVSQFVPTGKKEGIIYAHVDDSFVRAYTIKAEKIKSLIPKNYR